MAIDDKTKRFIYGVISGILLFVALDSAGILAWIQISSWVLFLGAAYFAWLALKKRGK